MNNNLTEFGLPLLLVAVLATLVWPVSQDHTMVMATQGILLAGIIALALFVWRESIADERESLHRMAISRIAYLVGAGVLVAGIVVQSVRGVVDPWLVWALMAMVVAKVVGSVWLRLHR
jgi:hypothetical protein